MSQTDKYTAQAAKGDKFMANITVKEDADKCCFCIPIDIGAILLSCGTILAAFSFVSQAFKNLRVGNPAIAIAFGVASVPSILGSLIVLNWFKDRDNKDAKANLPTALLCNAVTNIGILMFLAVYTFLYTFALG